PGRGADAGRVATPDALLVDEGGATFGRKIDLLHRIRSGSDGEHELAEGAYVLQRRSLSAVGVVRRHAQLASGDGHQAQRVAGARDDGDAAVAGLHHRGGDGTDLDGPL